MRIFLIALLAAISYAQTGGAAPAAGASQGAAAANPFMYGMYDEMMDFGDMYPEVGDFYDNDILPMMNGLGFGQPSAGGSGASAGGSIFDQIGAMQMPYGLYDGDVSDMMSDVVDNLKDGDMQDVMSNLLPLAQMGLPGLDMNSIMQGGMPNLNGIMQGLMPYAAMDGDMNDLMGDLGDLYNFGSDMFEDYFKYGGMQGMGGPGGFDMSSIMQMMGGMGMSTAQQQLQKARLHKKLRRRRPSRLLKKTRSNRKLRKPREFPWYAFGNMFSGNQQSGQSGSQTGNPLSYMFDAPDSEDIANFLMMGGNRNAIPPPLDGIDTEDLWMYRGTQWDPMNYFNKATGKTTNADGTPAKTTVNPWIWAMLSGLQKAHMQKKF